MSPTGSTTTPRGTDDPRLPAAVDMIERTGAHQFVLRWCDEGEREGEPVVWLAMARHVRHWSVAAGLTPQAAVFALCDSLVDGGTCTHCQRPTGFAPDLDAMPLDALVCWYQYDPGAQRFGRSCAGSAP